MRPWIVILIAVLTAAIAEPAAARPDRDDPAGRIVGRVGDRIVELPLLRADYEIAIAGDIATVTLTQEFANPSRQPMSAEYLFPLDTAAAVYAMRMQVGDEVVRAVIRKKEEAEATFRKALDEGRAAALLTQHRPNMFTQSVANLMPGLPITVSLSYVQPVPRVDDANELVVPLVVGPRYRGRDETGPSEVVIAEASTLLDAGYAPATDAPDPVATASPERGRGEWTIEPAPAYPPVAGPDLPGEIDPDRIGLRIRLTGGGVPVGGIASATHALSIEEDEDGLAIGLREGRTIGNRDFVLRYELGGDAVTAGGHAHLDERGGFFSMQVAPPRVPDEALAMAREMVFVLDTSGSMRGAPLKAAKSFMDAALAALRPDDHFRIIAFSDAPEHFSSGAQRATASALWAARKHVASLSASGGTEMNRAINAAFDAAQPDGALRIVVFLTDGYIGREADVLASIRSRIGDARIHAFGIGSSVNRYLLDAMAEEGRGYARYVDPTQDAEEVAQTLARDLRSPLLTDISIDWGGMLVEDVVPQRLPDLFAGNTLRLFGRYRTGGRHTVIVIVRGRVRGRKASLPVTLDLPIGADDASPHSEAVALMWARGRIADLERREAVREGDADEIKASITRLGLTHSLQTRHTSFVAVSERVVNDTGIDAGKREVAQPQVAGIEASAYPERPRLAAAPSPRANPVSGPGPLMMLTMLAVLGGLLLRRR